MRTGNADQEDLRDGRPMFTSCKPESDQADIYLFRGVENKLDGCRVLIASSLQAWCQIDVTMPRVDCVSDGREEDIRLAGDACGMVLQAYPR
jgi:hypothetical protein